MESMVSVQADELKDKSANAGLESASGDFATCGPAPVVLMFD
jgi:hypothetical protein